MTEQTNQKTLGQVAYEAFWWNMNPDDLPDLVPDAAGRWEGAAQAATAKMQERIAELEAKVEHLQKIVDRKSGRICMLCDGPIVGHYCSKCDMCTR